MASEHQGQATYYVPEQSKYPFLASAGVGLMLVGVATWLNDLHAHREGSPALLMVGFALLATVLFNWFGTAISENIKGMNSAQLKRSYRIGMQWFIFSEVMFFATFFGGLFYLRELVGPWLSGEGVGHFTNEMLWKGFSFSWPMMETPQQAVGGVANQLIANNGVFIGPEKNMSWPGVANAAHWLPLWNTVLLVTSSVTCEIAHHALKANPRGMFKLMLGVTVALGLAFVYFQGVEYHEAYTEMGLTLKSGIYGTTFFMLTGFHGFHVCLGAFMLLVMFIRALKGHFNKDDHFGFEGASWYWHFVDVVWLFLVAVVYVF
jgi:cytochrome c oxidase subunit 3